MQQKRGFTRSDDDYLANEIRNFIAEMKKMQNNHTRMEKLIETKETERKETE